MGWEEGEPRVMRARRRDSAKEKSQVSLQRRPEKKGHLGCVLGMCVCVCACVRVCVCAITNLYKIYEIYKIDRLSKKLYVLKCHFV